MMLVCKWKSHENAAFVVLGSTLTNCVVNILHKNTLGVKAKARLEARVNA